MRFDTRTIFFSNCIIVNLEMDYFIEGGKNLFSPNSTSAIGSKKLLPDVILLDKLINESINL